MFGANPCICEEASPDHPLAGLVWRKSPTHSTPGLVWRKSPTHSTTPGLVWRKSPTHSTAFTLNLNMSDGHDFQLARRARHDYLRTTSQNDPF